MKLATTTPIAVMDCIGKAIVSCRPTGSDVILTNIKPVATTSCTGVVAEIGTCTSLCQIARHHESYKALDKAIEKLDLAYKLIG